MSLQATWVRARDGALYKEPLLVFPEGFICFGGDEPELVLWLSPNALEGLPSTPPLVVLELRLAGGFSAWSLRTGSRSERVLPGTDPWEFMPALSFFFALERRIPRPQIHEGYEIHARRCGACHMIDPPAHALDAYQIEMPSSSTNTEALRRDTEALLERLLPALQADGYTAVARTCRQHLEEIVGTLDAIDLIRSADQPVLTGSGPLG